MISSRRILILAGAWLLLCLILFAFPLLVELFHEFSKISTTALALAMGGPATLTYGRLGNFDKIEDLPPQTREFLLEFVGRARPELMRQILTQAALVCLFPMALWVFANGDESFRYGAIVAFAGITVFVLLGILQTYWLWAKTEDIQRKVMIARQKHTTRRKLIEQMRKEAASSPLKLDAHLEGYRIIAELSSESAKSTGAPTATSGQHGLALGQ